MAHFSFSQRGKDGSYTVTGTTVVNEYTRLIATAISASTTITIQSTTLNANSRFSGNLQPGDLLFIMQVQGVEITGAVDPSQANAGIPNNNTWGNIIDYRNVGLYEYAEVKSIISGSQIELTCGLQHDYTLGNFSEKVIVVRVPRYNDLTISNGATLTADAWDGQTGGVVVVEVLGNTVVNGTIDVSEKGFRGGDLNTNTGNYEWHFTGSDATFGGEKGEGIAGYKTELNIFGGMYGMGAPANGGGAGNSHNGGGAGGANASKPTLTWTGKGIPQITNPAWANAWNVEQAGLATSHSSGGGRGGYCWSTSNGDALTQPPGDAVWGGHNRANYGGVGGRPLDYSAGRIFFGGGGGAGHQNDSEGGKGGSAAGIVMLNTYGPVTGVGSITANGQEGTGSDQLSAPFSGQVNRDGSGGGGAGGTILIKNIGGISIGSIEAKGGDGGNQVIRTGLFGGSLAEAQGPGGGGSGGYVGLSTLGVISDLEGGINGTTNSSSITEFPPNGATKGDTGYLEQINSNYNIIVDNDTICGGGTVTISPTIVGVLPTTGGQLDWYDSYFSQTSLHTGNTFTTPILNTTTTYYFGGCNIPFRDSVTIVVSPPIVIDSSSISITHESCDGNDGSITGITASGGLGALEYYWNNTLSTSIDTINLSGGTFELIVFDSIGCSDTLSNLVVNGTFVPTIDTSFMVKVKDTCARVTGELNGVIVTGGSGSYLYEVNGIIVPSLNVNNLSAGIHQVVVIDNNSGCTDTMDIPIGLISPPSLFLGNDTTICTGQSLLLDGTTTGVTYLWQDASTNANFNVVSPGLYWLEIDAGGCTARDSINVAFTNGTPVNLGNDTTLCAGQSLLLDATVAGATYEWQDFSTNSTFLVTTAGQYYVEVDEGGCINRDTINVTYSNTSLSLGNDTSLCDLDSLVFDISQPGATYLWSDASTNAKFSITGPGLYWGEIKIGNCTARDSINVTYGVSPNPNFGNDTTICSGETLLLEATVPGATYEWQDLSTNATYTVSFAGQYHVEVNNNGCLGRDTIDVTYQNVQVDLGSDVVLCDAQTLTLDITEPGATYLWSDASTNATLTIANQGLYWGEVTIGNCSDRDSINITYEVTPVVYIGNDTLICDDQELYLDASVPGATYLWDDGTMLPNRTIDEEGQYYVRVTNGCGVDNDTININTKDCSCNIFMPNAFSPNGDGFNDVYIPQISCEFHQFELRIYNRQGILVYYSEDPKETWDGNHKGGVNESEVYVWTLKYRIIGDVEIQVKRGHLTMVR